MSLLNGAVTGNYERRWHYPERIDCIQVHSFGSDVSAASVNRQLAEYALDEAKAEDLPILADQNAAKAFPEDTKRPIVVAGSIGEGIFEDRPGTWGALLAMQEIMDENGWKHPELVGHAFHVGRITLQAAKLGMHPRVPAGLPRKFDWRSGQLWTRNRVFWIPYEFIATRKLQRDDQL